MKAQRTLKLAAIYSAAVALILAAVLLTVSLATPASAHGNTGQALLLRSLLHLKTAKRIYGANPFSADRRLHFLQNGRFNYGKNGPVPQTSGVHNPNVGPTAAVLINEAVQTYDVFLPAPTFAPVAGALTPTNLTPVWTNDESELVYSSNAASDGHYHIFAISSSGGTPVQLTTGPGNEYFPILSPTNNFIAFTSDALSTTAGTHSGTTTNQDLYVLPFDRSTATPTDISTLTASSGAIKTLGDSAVLTNVGRPTWSPDETEIAFSALTTTGTTAGHRHIYFLNVNSNGYRPPNSGSGANPPARLTNGVENDDDAAWSTNGQYIAFTSNATVFTNTGQPFSPNGAPSQASGTNGNRGIFIVGANGQVPPSLMSRGGLFSAAGTTNVGPAWAFNGTQFQGGLTFSRLNGSHYDIYYFRALNIATNTLSPEGSTPASALNQLNTSDPGNKYNDLYPAWAPAASFLDIAYQSPRSITYNSTVDNSPQETPTSLVPGTAYAALSLALGAGYQGIFVSQVVNVDPATLLFYNPTEVLDVNDGINGSTKNVQPGQNAIVTLRLSDREAGLDDTNVYLQIKDPDSRYQDSQGQEHKVFIGSGNQGDGTSNILFQGGGISTVGMATFGLNGLIGFVPDNNNTISVGTGNTNSTNPIGGVPGEDPNQYTVHGAEYEAQYLKANYAGPDTTTSDYGVPFYLAGVDDQAPQSGGSAPPRPEWLKMTRAATQDKNGGVLYTATWKTPISPSDFYLDVITYDKAENWRIYDNVGGFTTQTFDGSKGILIVNDNQLGQKFAASVFGGKAGFSNIRPTLYGTESYYTDPDINLLPNSVEFFKVPPALPTPPAPPAPAGIQLTQTLATYPNNNQVTLVWQGTTVAVSYNVYRSVGTGTLTLLTNVLASVPTTYTDTTAVNGTQYCYQVAQVFANGTEDSVRTNLSCTSPLKSAPTQPQKTVLALTSFGQILPGPENGLGVGSYIDSYIDDNGQGNRTPTAANTPTSQQYTIWRILSRGPIPRSVLLSYAPTFQDQPAVNDPAGDANGRGVTEDKNVPVAPKCVIWASPYTGDLLVGPGSIADANTQSDLKAFTQAGGRLFVSGQDVATALTNYGTVNTSSSGFLATVLNAGWTSDTGGNQQLAGLTKRISGDAFFNVNPPLPFNMNYYEWDPPGPPAFVYHPPAANPIFLSNDYDQIVGDFTLWRTDGSPDQIGPEPESFGDNAAVGHLDTISAQNGATTDINYGAGSPGLIYHEDTTDALGSGFGSRAVFASFGVEGIGLEYYTRVVGTTTFYLTRNQRPHILHNIVCYLRTGTFSGTIRDTSGSGGGVAVPGATVYLEAAGGTIPGLPAGRLVFSATTDNGGNFRIDGVEPGLYNVHAYKSGYSSVVSNVSYGVEGGTKPITVNLTISPITPGVITGLVKDTTGKPVSGASVTYKSVDGQITVGPVITNAQGRYTISNVPSAAGGGEEYTGQATQGQAKSNVVDIFVQSGQTTNAPDLILPPQPGLLSGKVTDSATGVGISGATVTFTPSSGTATSATTNSSGVYTSANLPAGTYSVTATATGYQPQTKTSITVTASTTTTLNFALVKAVNGTLGGLVEDAASNAPIVATITVTDPASGTVIATLTSKGTTSTGPDGSPLNYSGAVPQGTYSVTATIVVSGNTLTSPSKTVTIKPNTFTRADFTGTGAPQPFHIFSAGFNFFSLPYDYSGTGVTWDTLFGKLNVNRSHIAVWAPDLLQYLSDPTPPAGTGPQLGVGYWVKLVKPVSLTTLGTAPVASTVTVGLKKGWNQIGTPSLTAIKVSALQFSAGTSGNLTFDQAVSSQFHLIMGTLYRYDGTNYQPVVETDNSSSPRDTTLKPYQAYWIFAYANTTIIIPTHG